MPLPSTCSVAAATCASLGPAGVKRTPLARGFLRMEAGPEVEDVAEDAIAGVEDAAQEIERCGPRSPGGGAVKEAEGPSLRMRKWRFHPPRQAHCPAVPIAENASGHELAHKRRVVGLGAAVEPAAVLFDSYDFVVVDVTATRQGSHVPVV